MAQPLDAVRPTQPSGVDPAAVPSFRADLEAPHPLRTADARLADLEALQVPHDLRARLQRWSRYFTENRTQADGRNSNTPASWWLAEREALPRDVAALFGSQAAIRVVGGYVHSDQPPVSEEAASVLARIALERADSAAADAVPNSSSFAYVAGSDSTQNSSAQTPDA